MMVDARPQAADLTDVYTLNETAARLWEHIGHDEVRVPELASWLSLEYGIEYEAALADVTRQIEEWRLYGLTE